MRKVKKYVQGRWNVCIFLILGLFGALLRACELIRYYDRLTGLFDEYAAAPVLPVYTGVCIAAALVCAFRYRGKAGSFNDVYRMESRGAVVMRLLCGLVLIVAGFLKTVSALRTLLHSIQEVIYLQSLAFLSGMSIAGVVFGLLTLLVGIGYIVLTNSRCIERMTETTQFFVSIPIYWSCYLLVLTFMEHPVEPVLRSFAYDLLAGCAMVMALYGFVGRAYDKLQRGSAVFFSLSSVLLLTISFGSRVLAVVMTGDPQWLTEAAFRMACFFVADVMIFIDAIPLINAQRQEAQQPSTNI